MSPKQTVALQLIQLIKLKVMRHMHADLPSQNYYAHYYCVGLLFVTSEAMPLPPHCTII